MTQQEGGEVGGGAARSDSSFLCKMWLGSKSFEPLLVKTPNFRDSQDVAGIPLHPGWIKGTQRLAFHSNAIPTSPGIFLSSEQFHWLPPSHPPAFNKSQCFRVPVTPTPVLPEDDDDDVAGLGSQIRKPARGHVSVPCSLRWRNSAPRWRHFSLRARARPGASLLLSSVRAGPSAGRRGGGNQDPGLSKSGSPRKHQKPRACAPARLPRPLQGQHHLWMLENFSPKKNKCFLEGEKKKKTCATWFIFQIKKKNPPGSI